MTIHLNGRSHFSVGESLLAPDTLVEGYAAKGATVLTLTDTMRISGMPEFVKACQKHKIKPIIGARLRIVDELTHDKASKRNNRAYFLRLLVRNDAGYQALLRLLSRAFTDQNFYEVPRLLVSDVAEIMGPAGPDASLVTLGDFYGAHGAGRARQVWDVLRDASVPVASEITPLATPYFVRHAYEALTLQHTEGLSACVAMPAFYAAREQAETLDLMACIARNVRLGPISARPVYRDFTPKDETELMMLVARQAQALSKRYGKSAGYWVDQLRTSLMVNRQIADSVSFTWEKAKPSLPAMSANEFGDLVRACQRGWGERFKRPMFGHQPTDLEPYRERLKYELGILRTLKFEAYFLLVAEIVTWAKAQGIRVGAGRGSVGGSLVAYLMGITDIDPIRFNLLFERFINPDRIDLPDADLDFMGTRREEVIAYITQRVGEPYVAAVSNYGTMAAASALKETCRALDIPEIMAFSKLVPKEHGNSYSLEQALEEVPELAKFAK
jgi:DNA polymerase-3 subunit alpha